MKYIELVKGLFTDIHVARAKQMDPYVAYSTEDDKFMFNLPPEPQEPVVYGSYVTFTAEQDGSSIGLEKLSANQTLEYSTDATTWNAFGTTTTIPLNNGDKVSVRGMLSADNTMYEYTKFIMRGKIAASGNCNAIWNYQDLNAPLKKYCGYYMFLGCASLTTAPELPTTTLAQSCYGAMFSSCRNLVTAPNLPATILALDCYSSMFSNCTSLTTAPVLPATTLMQGCYSSMFSNCTSITTAPALPATELTKYCYSSMFSGCINLTISPVLHAITLDTNCYSDMFRDCTALVTAPALPATTLASGCYSNMFSNCTSLVTAPNLPATTLSNSCYFQMFSNCTNLNHIECLATDISAGQCTSRWVDGVASTGTFIKHPGMNDWSRGISGIPVDWTVEDAEL